MNQFEKMASKFKIMHDGREILNDINNLIEKVTLIEALANCEKGPVTIFNSNYGKIITLNPGDDIPSMVSGFIASTHSTSRSEEVSLASLLSRSTSGSAGGGPPGTRSKAGGDLGRSIYSNRHGPLLAGTPSVAIGVDPLSVFLSNQLLGGSTSLLGGRSEERSHASLLDGSCSKCGHDFCGRKYKMRRNGLTSSNHRQCGSFHGSICCNCTVNEGWKKENHI